ncbi:MAG TPA: hypothetical protein VGI66_03670 [Streptosporangiaceae bacterium]|jgi:hypothetical protein
MTTAVLTPFTGKPAIQTGNRVWRKLLLPIGEIRYKGSVLKFTRTYLDGLANAFRSRAYDQVPFQAAPDDNSHSNDIERFRGEITDMAVDNDGLWVTLEPTERGEAILKENPKLGVSARIVEDYDRADGKYFPAAIQHVLGTLDPRIPGMGPWAAVEAANTPDVIIDLSGAEFAGEGDSDMPLSDEQQAKLARLLGIPDDKFDQLIEGLNMPELTDEELAALAGDGEDELTDEELEELLATAADLDAQGLLEPEPAGAGAALSAADSMAIELANARADENERQLSVIAAELDSQRFLTERRRLADAGVPPYITDLARELLEGTGHVVELSNGTKRVDAGAVMRRVLTEFGKMSGMLDLSVELGSGADEPAGASDKAEERLATVHRFRSQVGI